MGSTVNVVEEIGLSTLAALATAKGSVKRSTVQGGPLKSIDGLIEGGVVSVGA
jgi:hypothetical protein